MSAERTFLEQIRGGDREAWREFIALYEGRLAAFVRARLDDAAAVDDVVQETFLGFLVSLPNYDPSRGLETYLFTIAAHKLTDVLRRRGRRPTVPLTVGDASSAAEREPADSARSAGSYVRSAERRNLESAALSEALTTIVGRWRERGEFVRVACLELLFVRGFANKETAATLGLSEQQVANYKFDFLERLRDALRRKRLSPDVFPELTAPR